MNNQEIENLIAKNLREKFHELVEHILGKNYYNLGMDVYSCDELSCDDIKYQFEKLKEKLGFYKFLSVVCGGVALCATLLFILN